MFSKRPDKHTTGLINMRNDCFANSTVQAYSALPGLTVYLNRMMEAYINVLELVADVDADLDDIILPENIVKLSRSKEIKHDQAPKKAFDLFKLTLHVALAKIVKKLQETQMTSRTVSVWTFLHEIERIYNAKISRSQHDAHELTQLINETLEAENILCVRILKHIRETLSAKGHISPALEQAEFPEFPFGGLVLSQMKCLACSHVSKPNISPFLMMTLHPPQETSTKLETLLDENEAETITEYHCLKCRLLRIIANEKCLKDLGKLNPESEEALVRELISLNDENRLFINEDLRKDLEKYVDSYNKLGLDILKVHSTVFRQCHILKPPKLFGIHLSRSAFDGVTLSRNPCRVHFSDKISLSIDEKFLEDLQKFQSSSDDEAFAPVLEHGVLTTDVNDMEDENVQQEDVDLKGDEGEETDNLESSDADTQTQSDSDSDSESVSLSLVEDAAESVRTEVKGDTLNRAPISEDQQQSLIKHFSRFEFSENNIYKYRLKAIIKHQGSHTQGHYECYRRKPLFVKDGEGKIVKLSPEIDEELLMQVDKVGGGSGDHFNKERTTSMSTVDLQDTLDSEKGAFRRKFSMIMGRRPSILQADPHEANLQEIINSGLATPAEVMVDGGNYFLAPSALDIQKLMDKIARDQKPSRVSRVKMKKIPSLIKSPFWRVGDSHVTEATKSAVLFETTSVYMLYFERVDRKQL
ncbi:cysteine proteinase [Metschnikowia bicuspidata var. bicuspidata NRRL YB-4993]|uniref:Cysteine proteinase n=1 Tax=Metschnikowia bicuspidata var. bicuspidata NRRL YB-4993 TaxID=869754 RepID=A0A1A0H656_9ASCO|nr:cysteine proteinase [Metschnikowia bicuspidata var. bicuspidata NRRL YB-4993]OBA19569.1 cysteine proteinase [Metschnikowia bicuspidata var. bicuspidata NRRL YB-4993]